MFGHEKNTGSESVLTRLVTRCESDQELISSIKVLEIQSKGKCQFVLIYPIFFCQSRTTAVRATTGHISIQAQHCVRRFFQFEAVCFCSQFFLCVPGSGLFTFNMISCVLYIICTGNNLEVVGQLGNCIAVRHPNL